MSKLINSLWSVSFAIMMLTGCVNSKGQIPQEDKEKTQIESSYPAPNDPMSADLTLPGYIPPKTTLSPASISKLVVLDPPEPDKSLGSLSGLIIDSNLNSLLNYMNICLYHSINMEDNSFPPFIIGCNEQNGDIEGKTDANGQFIFKNVPPGKYFLIVTIDQSPIFQSPENVQPLLIQVDADNVLNLGVVYYTSR